MILNLDENLSGFLRRGTVLYHISMEIKPKIDNLEDSWFLKWPLTGIKDTCYKESSNKLLLIYTRILRGFEFGRRFFSIPLKSESQYI